MPMYLRKSRLLASKVTPSANRTRLTEHSAEPLIMPVKFIKSIRNYVKFPSRWGRSSHPRYLESHREPHHPRCREGLWQCLSCWWRNWLLVPMNCDHYIVLSVAETRWNWDAKTYLASSWVSKRAPTVSKRRFMLRLISTICCVNAILIVICGGIEESKKLLRKFWLSGGLRNSFP